MKLLRLVSVVIFAERKLGSILVFSDTIFRFASRPPGTSALG